MLTRTRLGSLVNAELDAAPRGTTFTALLALVGESNREWLYGFLNAQKRTRPPVLVQLGDGRYIRPQCLVVPAEREYTDAEREVAREAARVGWEKRKKVRPQSPSKWELERQASRQRVADRHQRYMRVVCIWRKGGDARAIAEAEGVTVDEGRRLLKCARSWWNREGRP